MRKIGYALMLIGVAAVLTTSAWAAVSPDTAAGSDPGRGDGASVSKPSSPVDLHSMSDTRLHELLKAVEDMNAQSGAYRKAGMSRDEFAAARREYVTSELKLLQLLIDNGVVPRKDFRCRVTNAEDYPDLVLHDYTCDPHVTKEQIRIDDEKYAAAAAALQASTDHESDLSLLCFYRDNLVESVCCQYLLLPYTPLELRELTLSIVKDKATVREILGRVSKPQVYSGRGKLFADIQAEYAKFEALRAADLAEAGR